MTSIFEKVGRGCPRFRELGAEACNVNLVKDDGDFIAAVFAVTALSREKVHT